MKKMCKYMGRGTFDLNNLEELFSAIGRTCELVGGKKKNSRSKREPENKAEIRK